MVLRLQDCDCEPVRLQKLQRNKAGGGGRDVHRLKCLEGLQQLVPPGLKPIMCQKMCVKKYVSKSKRVCGKGGGRLCG